MYECRIYLLHIEAILIGNWGKYYKFGVTLLYSGASIINWGSFTFLQK